MIQDWIERIFCADCKNRLLTCHSMLENSNKDNAMLHERIKELELMLPRPPPPELDNWVERDSLWIQSVLMSMDAKIIRSPLGNEVRLVDKDTFMEFVAWSWVDSFEYHKFFRCGNFAISFKAEADQWGVNQVGIVLDYVSSHAYNIVVFPDGKVMLLEPQSDSIFFHKEKLAKFYTLKGAVVII